MTNNMPPRRWNEIELTIYSVYVKVADGELEHILERMKQYRLSFEDIDLTLRTGKVIEGNGFDKRRNCLGDYRLQFKGKSAGLITSGELIFRKRGLTKCEQMFRKHGLIIKLRTVYRRSNKRTPTELERRVEYLFDTDLLNIK